MLSGFIKKLRDAGSSEQDINLLLLGETGVGKSTFINSLSNYFNFPNFEAAQKGNIDVLIPVRLNLTNCRKIYGNSDGNENFENGAAATQHVKVYLFPIKIDGKVINLRLVDTPGVGDPRGVERDDENLDNILAYLATIKKLHGICLFVKANNNRFTKFVEYCLKEILSRLDKSASNNIIFITTFSKIAQYSAGETKTHCLERLVASIEAKPPHVSIPLTECNTFCLDNEAFRALLEIKEGKKLENYELQGLSKSWRISSYQCRRLLTYIIGDSRNEPLKPHDVENTISVNEVRFLIEQLTTPMAEVSENIQDNLMILDRHRKNLGRENQSLDELKQQLFIPCVELRVKELNQPVTVCTDPKCADVVKVNDVTQWHYKQRCHNPCYLKGVPREMVGDPELMNCEAINEDNYCMECGCHYTVHMHIYKETEKVHTQREDESVKDAIRSKEDIRAKINHVVQEVNKLMNELENESEIISESVAKFSYFLQEHALTPFNDAYSDYIKQLIKTEKHFGKLADFAIIEKLQNLLYKHEQLQETFQESQRKFQPGEFDLSPISIKQSIRELYSLRHMGKKIEELIEKSNACRYNEIQEKFNCLVSQQINWNTTNEQFDDADNQKCGGSSSERVDNSRNQTKDEIVQESSKCVSCSKDDYPADNTYQNRRSGSPISQEFAENYFRREFYESHPTEYSSENYASMRSYRREEDSTRSAYYIKYEDPNSDHEKSSERRPRTHDEVSDNHTSPVTQFYGLHKVIRKSHHQQYMSDEKAISSSPSTSKRRPSNADEQGYLKNEV